MSLSEEAKEWLTSYRWPGNVRELQHVLSRAALLSEQEEISGVELSRWAKDKNNMAAPAKANDATTLLLQKPNGQFKTLTELEEEIFEAALIHHRAHIGRAAAALGIGQSTLYKRMRKNSA